MKKKFLALVMTLAMVLSLVPMTALATEGVTEETQADTQVEQEGEGIPSTNPDDPDASETVIVPEGKAAIGKKIYNSLAEAVQEAESGATIQLGKGTYSGNTAKPTEQGEGAGKSLTFIGAGTGETTWQIQATKQYGSDGWCDYSFKGSDRITFENMTVIGSVYSDGSTKANDTQGLTYINHITLKDCIFNGRADYWGYQSTTFENVIFNAPGTEASGVTSGNYSLWTYTGENYTFKNCTFNSQSGKTVNVYRHGGPDYDIIVNFEDCTFNTESHSPYFYPNPVNINDSTLKAEHKYVINFTGNMKTNGFSPIKLTCSRLFCFGSDLKGTQNNTKKTVVNFNGTTVWQDGKMVDAKAYHNKGVTVDGVTYDNGVAGANDSLYAEGYKDNAFTTTESDWTFNPQDGKMHGTVTKTCNYCGDEEVTKETKEPTPVEPDDPNAPVWQTSKSKKAINLDNNYESKVTLSLPSAQENLVTDVVFVLDESSCTEQVQKSVNSMLEQLYSHIQNTGAKIKIGAVQFRGSVRQLNLTELNEETKNSVTEFMSTKPDVKGSNMNAGLLAAQKMLKADIGVDDGRKYVILVSDGITYIWDDENTKDQENYGVNSANQDSTEPMLANPQSWDIKYYAKYIPTDWATHFSTIQTLLDKTIQEKASIYIRNVDISSNPYIAYEEKDDYASTVDIALYKSYEAYQALASKYHTYSVCAGNEGEMKVLPWGPSFMEYLANGEEVSFEEIQNEIIYLLDNGSYVTDYMGYVEGDYNFDFINDASKLTITVGRGESKETLKAEKIGENCYGFEPMAIAQTLEEGTPEIRGYQYVLEYVPGEKKGDEHFVWHINVPVSNFDPVALTYSVKLVNPKSASGTYGQYDVDGSKNYSGLYTNNSATLYPKDSNENWGIPENFLKPTVSYTVSGGSGGNHKPTITIPDDVPTGLNGKDHYAYVVGYPDGMVYPQKNITRAEVATIFFRLLEDETREANMTKSNGYNDMKDGAWYTCAVSTLSKMGIIKGYEDGSFKPDASISRAEFAAIAARFDPDGDKTPATFSDVSSHWAKDEISIAANHGWIKGYEDGSFKPDQKITRAETMTLVNRVLKRLPETKDDLHKDMKTWPDNQNESAWFYLAVQEATNSHYQKLKKDGTHETWESMRETRDWAALEK